MIGCVAARILLALDFPRSLVQLFHHLFIHSLILIRIKLALIVSRSLRDWDWVFLAIISW